MGDVLGVHVVNAVKKLGEDAAVLGVVEGRGDEVVREVAVRAELHNHEEVAVADADAEDGEDGGVA